MHKAPSITRRFSMELPLTKHCPNLAMQFQMVRERPVSQVSGVEIRYLPQQKQKQLRADEYDQTAVALHTCVNE